MIMARSCGVRKVGVADNSLSVYVRKLNVVIFFAIILQNTFKIS